MRTRNFTVLALAMVLVGSPVWAHDDCPWNNVHGGCGQPGHIHLEDMERKATLMNLSPWQAWVHLYCQEPDGDCSVTFECNGMSGEPATWNVIVPPKTIFILLAEQDGGRKGRQLASGPDGSGQVGGRSPAQDHVRSIQRR